MYLYYITSFKHVVSKKYREIEENVHPIASVGDTISGTSGD